MRSSPHFGGFRKWNRDVAVIPSSARSSESFRDAVLKLIASDPEHVRLARRYIRDRAQIQEGGCWIWTQYISGRGYGGACFLAATLLAHRLSYTVFVGVIPQGLTLDHLCRVRHCVNPAHLEAVTNRENSLRGESPHTVAHRTNRCIRGHTLEDAYVDGRGRRKCRHCERLRRHGKIEASEQLTLVAA